MIWGAGGHGRVVADAIAEAGNFQLVAWVDDVNPAATGTSLCGAPILGGPEDLRGLVADGVEWAIIAIGQGEARSKLAAEIASLGLKLAVVVHPRATVAKSVRIGAGTFLAAGAIIAPGVELGPNVIVNHGASVDHDCVVEESAHICPGVHLAGNVTVGERAWIGIGAAVIEGITIGADAFIGGGAVVVRDVPPNALAFGNPARIDKTRKS